MTKHGRSRRRKKVTSKLSAEEGTENRCRLTDAEVRQRTKTKDIVEVAHSVKWKWRAHVTGMDQRGWAHVASTWCLRDRQKKNGAIEDLIGRHVQECSRRTMVTKSQKL
jgi:hypothetical protein